MFNTDVQATWDIVFLRNDLRKCVNKKHPEQVKTDLTNLKVFSTFCRLDCTNSKGFQPSEELEKITAPASLHVTFIDSTQRLTRSSAVFFGYLPNIINDCYCRRSSYSPDKASPSFVILQLFHLLTDKHAVWHAPTLFSPTLTTEGQQLCARHSHFGA